MKLRILHYPEKGKIATFAEGLSAALSVKADKIPPAYNCDRERLLIAGISCGKSLPSELSLFLRGLSKDRVQNVAIFTDAPESAVAEMKQTIETAGASVLDVKAVKGSALPFLKSVKPEEAEDLLVWAKGICGKLQ